MRLAVQGKLKFGRRRTCRPRICRLTVFCRKLFAGLLVSSQRFQGAKSQDLCWPGWCHYPHDATIWSYAELAGAPHRDCCHIQLSTVHYSLRPDNCLFQRWNGGDGAYLDSSASGPMVARVVSKSLGSREGGCTAVSHHSGLIRRLRSVSRTRRRRILVPTKAAHPFYGPILYGNCNRRFRSRDLLPFFDSGVHLAGTRHIPLRTIDLWIIGALSVPVS
jgi:hypothetical protein